MPMAKIGHFAGEARLTDAADMKKTGEAKRLTLPQDGVRSRCVISVLLCVAQLSRTRCMVQSIRA